MELCWVKSGGLYVPRAIANCLIYNPDIPYSQLLYPLLSWGIIDVTRWLKQLIPNTGQNRQDDYLSIDWRFLHREGQRKQMVWQGVNYKLDWIANWWGNEVQGGENSIGTREQKSWWSRRPSWWKTGVLKRRRKATPTQLNWQTEELSENTTNQQQHCSDNDN